MVITSQEQLRSLGNNNKFIGKELPTMDGSSIEFRGSNNILICTPGVILKNSRILFEGNGSVVFIGGTSRGTISIRASLRHYCVFYLGRNNYLNERLVVDCSESSTIFIGRDNLISHGITVRTADPHLLYDVNTMERLNLSKSVFIGDHVWLGQGVQIMKGTQISSGSIIGAGSIVSGKKIENNAVYAGNPARLIRSGVFFDNGIVHRWVKKDTEISMNYCDYLKASEWRKNQDPKQYIFEYTKNESISFQDIQRKISACFSEKGGALLVAEYLQELDQNAAKNRFVQPISHKKDRCVFYKLRRIYRRVLSGLK